jgi:hypothetical protein
VCAERGRRARRSSGTADDVLWISLALVLASAGLSAAVLVSAAIRRRSPLVGRLQRAALTLSVGVTVLVVDASWKLSA